MKTKTSTAETMLKTLKHFNACNCEDCQNMVDFGSARIAYLKGYRPARYPVPAVPVHTGFVPSGTGPMRNVPYIWVTYGYNRLTTYWKGLDPILEWFDTDGKRHYRRIVSFK